jgi:hypothetical protein
VSIFVVRPKGLKVIFIIVFIYVGTFYCIYNNRIINFCIVCCCYCSFRLTGLLVDDGFLFLLNIISDIIASHLKHVAVAENQFTN